MNILNELGIDEQYNINKLISTSFLFSNISQYLDDRKEKKNRIEFLQIRELMTIEKELYI